MGNNFSKVNVGNIILVNKQILFEIIEKRIYQNGVKIEDLFLLCVAPDGNEGEQLVDTPYGKLRVFFLKNGWKGKTWLLNVKKHPYPKVSKVSTKHLVKRSEDKFDPFTMNPLTEMANQHIKDEFKVN